MTMKSEIIQNTVQLFHTYGIRNLSMDDIARLSEISVKMLNKYFINKEALIKACIEYKIYQESIFRYTDGNLLDTLLNYAETYPGLYNTIDRRCCMDIKKYHNTAYTFLIENMNHYAITCENKISKGIADGYIKKKTSPGLIHAFLQERFSRLFTTDVFQVNTNVSMMTEMILAFIKGISTGKGRIYIDQKLK